MSLGSSILIAIYITIFACIYHENDNDISAIYALRRDPQGVGGAGHNWERPTLLNPPAFRREVLPATIRGSTSRYGTSVEAPVLDMAPWRGLCRNRSGTSRRRHVRMVRVALDVATDSRWSKSTTVRLALELEPINLEPCSVQVPVWIPCWSVAKRWYGGVKPLFSLTLYQ